MSHVSTGLEVKHKLVWVADNYNGTVMKDYCVFLRKAKLNVVNALLMSRKYSVDEILVVDSNIEVVNMLGDAGCQACTPLEIVNYMKEVE